MSEVTLNTRAEASSAEPVAYRYDHPDRSRMYSTVKLQSHPELRGFTDRDGVRRRYAKVAADVRDRAER